jgi:hypothetical protein
VSGTSADSAAPIRLHPAPPTRDPLRFAPLFVLATARSYSSVVTTMIGQHPQLAGLPELKLFCCETIGELEGSLPGFWRDRGVTHRSPGLLRALAECELGRQTAATIAAAREWLAARLDWSGANVMDFLQERLRPRTAVEKSPDNLLTDEALSRMAAAYPRARYLHLTRHPITTQRSIEGHRRRVFGRPLDGEPMRSIAAWYEIHRRILHFCADVTPDRYLQVRAEDVLHNPESQLAVIAAWLGIRADGGAIDAMLHPEASPFAHPGPEGIGITGGNDPGFLRDPVPRRVDLPCKLEQPPGWIADRSVWKTVSDLANRLGYL